jgi:hypothetical protein
MVQENNQVPQPVESKNLGIVKPLDPNQLVQVGGSTVAVILAIAFLIYALAEYNKVFIPVMMQRQEIPVEIRQQPVIIYEFPQIEKRE